MRRELKVRSTVIDWPDETLEVTDTSDTKYTVPLSKNIEVVMVGFPAREEKTMLARELGQYMSNGYIIEQVSFEE